MYTSSGGSRQQCQQRRTRGTAIAQCAAPDVRHASVIALTRSNWRRCVCTIMERAHPRWHPEGLAAPLWCAMFSVRLCGYRGGVCEPYVLCLCTCFTRRCARLYVAEECSVQLHVATLRSCVSRVALRTGSAGACVAVQRRWRERVARSGRATSGGRMAQSQSQLRLTLFLAAARACVSRWWATHCSLL